MADCRLVRTPSLRCHPSFSDSFNYDGRHQDAGSGQQPILPLRTDDHIHGGLHVSTRRCFCLHDSLGWLLYFLCLCLCPSSVSLSLSRALSLFLCLCLCFLSHIDFALRFLLVLLLLLFLLFLLFLLLLLLPPPLSTMTVSLQSPSTCLRGVVRRSRSTLACHRLPEGRPAGCHRRSRPRPYPHRPVAVSPLCIPSRSRPQHSPFGRSRGLPRHQHVTGVR